jgi:peptidoglycan/xylan/chitin deacetylase (PgdA/CDA1 family)
VSTLAAIVRLRDSSPPSLAGVSAIAARLPHGTELVLVSGVQDERSTALLRGVAAVHGAHLVCHDGPGAAGHNAGVRATRSALLFFAQAGAQVAADFVAGAIERLAGDEALSFVAEGEGEVGPLALLTGEPGIFRPAVWRRSAFESLGGFDETLAPFEEQDLWLRALPALRGAWIGPASRPSRADTSLAPDQTAAAFRQLLEKHRAIIAGDPASVLVAQEERIRALASRRTSVRARREAFLAELDRLRAEKRSLEAQLSELNARFDWRDLRRPEAMSRRWGFDRGQPVDRYYIHQFIAAHREDIRGAVLEVMDTGMTRSFGGDRVTRSDVLDLDASNRGANVIADLRAPGGLPEGGYDCFILTQTLQLLDDPRAAIREAYRTLKPGGVLLATLPCASAVCVEYGPDADFWRVTEAGARELFTSAFAPADVEVTGFGNLLTSTAFLYGLAREELEGPELDRFDPRAPLIVGVRAVKPGAKRRPAVDRRASGAVLMYHRIAEAKSDVHRLCVSPAIFRAQLQHLAARYRVLPLAELARAAREGTVPPRAVAITFDDGYRDAWHAAAPALQQFGLPATFFVGAPGGEAWWWDALEVALLEQPPKIDRLRLRLGGEAQELALATPEDRRRAHHRLWQILTAAGSLERERLLAEILEATGAPDLGERARLGLSEIGRLSRLNGFEIGWHGATHTRMGSLDDEALRSELSCGRDLVERELGAKLDQLSYPHGDASDLAAAAARQAGFTLAVTVEPALVRAGTDPLRLPRLAVEPLVADAFSEWLDRWFVTAEARA